MFITKKTLLALLPFFLQINAQASGSGKSTRYWDCCKPSCSWPGKNSLASGSHPVSTCDRNDNYISDFDAKSGCNGGGAYMCTNQMPWAVTPDLAYGFAAVSISGGNEASWCCACYEITFTSGPVAGKKMIVQATNTGGDLGTNHFDLAMPGGGFGIFNGCTSEFGTPSTGWGQQYGGISSRSQCDAFSDKLKAGCYWRFDWFLNADNPNLTFRQITCPKVLTDRTGCVRNGEVPTTDPLPTTTTTTTTTRSTTSSSRTTTIPTTSSIRPTTTSSSSTTTRITTTSPSTTPSTTSRIVTTSSTTTAATGGPLAQRWGQCGGEGYTGPTTCVAPWKCVVTNQWYSQCL